MIEANKPSIFSDVAEHVGDLMVETREHGVPSIQVAKMVTLNLETLGALAARQEKPDYSTVIAEMKALGPVTEIPIDSRHKFIIGSTSALDPHTYLRLPSQQVVDAFRSEHMGGMEKDQIDSLDLPAHGFPPHIKPLDRDKPTYLPLHFVSWCFLEDTTTGKPEYKPVDALSFYANGIDKLTELGCATDNSEKAKLAMKEAHIKMCEISLRNRNVVAKLYNDHLLPGIVKAIVALDDNKKDGEHKIVNITGDDRAQQIQDLLTCNPHNQRVYCNFGHTPNEEQDIYDTGRGPATLEPWHNFTRYVPVDRFSMLVGTTGHGELSKDEYKDFMQLIRAVGSVVPGINDTNIIRQIKLEELGERDLSQYIKMIDPYSDYLAQYSVPVMSAVLGKCFEGFGEDIEIERNEHMAAATSLVASHGRSIKIKVTDRNSQYATESASDVEYGVAMMDRVYEPLQAFMEAYNDTYQQIFNLAVEDTLTEDTVRNITEKSLQAYSKDIKSNAIENLITALTQLKPTAKMEDARNSQGREKDGKTRNEHILRNDLVVGILQSLINNPELQSELASIVGRDGIGGSELRNFFESKNVDLPTVIKGDHSIVGQRDQSIWDAAYTDIFNNCFSQDSTGITIPQRIAARLVTAVLGLERRGKRTGVRSENIPRTPGLLMSYRVRKNMDGERVFELELGIASGQRAAFEIATGGMLVRTADQVSVSVT